MDKQTGKLIARIAENLPDMPSEIMQGWIESPKALQKFLASLNLPKVVVRHIIDCDANPHVPNGWEVVEHKKHGQLEWDPKKVSLYLSPNQQNGKVIRGDKLRKELAREPMLNANVLDYLLKNPHLIPEKWKGKAVFFWGTIYCGSDGNRYVRCLYFRVGWWDWSDGWLGSDWNDDHLAARLAS